MSAADGRRSGLERRVWLEALFFRVARRNQHCRPRVSVDADARRGGMRTPAGRLFGVDGGARLLRINQMGDYLHLGYFRGAFMSFIGRSSAARLVGAFVIVLLAAVLWVVIGGGGSTARATTADGDVVLGAFPVNQPCSPGVDVNCEQNSTVIQVQPGQDNNGLEVQADGFGFGVAGFTNKGIGVWGQSGSGHGVEGDSTSNYALYGDSTQATGGHIQTESQFGAGLEVAINNAGNARGAIEAQTNGTGQGLWAQATSGAGVEGDSTNGPGLYGVAKTSNATALKTKGTAVLGGPTTISGTTTISGVTIFSRSGRLTIPANSAQATKTPMKLGSQSSVLATIQGNQPGVYVQGVTTVTGTSGSFTVHLNKATPVNLTIAWFVLS